MSQFYKEHVKQEFLESVRLSSKNDDIGEETSKAYSRVFKRSAEFESDYGKDLYNFTIDELTEFFKALKPATKTASRTAGNIVTRYINWAIELGYSNINPLVNESVSFFEKFVPNQENQYLTKEEIDYIIDELVNDNDAVIFALLTEGVQGREASEIRNLKINDIKSDDNGTYVLVTDDKDGNQRPVYISEDTLTLIKRSHREPEYIKKNGEMEYNPRVKDTVELPSEHETPYVVKTGNTQGKHFGDRASKFTIYNRVEMIRDLAIIKDAGINPEILNTKNIVRSGMIYEAFRLLKEEGGELDNAKIEKICKKFNVKNHWAVRDFINMSVIKSLYGELPSTVKNN